MHELSLMADLLAKIEKIARREGAIRVKRVSLRLGALSHLEASHLRAHFADASRGRIAQGAELDITVGTDADDPAAQDVLLESLELELAEA